MEVSSNLDPCLTQNRISTLDEIALGMTVWVESLDEGLPLAERKRLESLGWVKGAPVRVGWKGPFGGLRSYRICGTQIALRDHQSSRIKVKTHP